jgi:hypothetical protein
MHELFTEDVKQQTINQSIYIFYVICIQKYCIYLIMTLHYLYVAYFRSLLFYFNAFVVIVTNCNIKQPSKWFVYDMHLISCLLSNVAQ